MIWVRDSERAAINQKRAALPWATVAFNGIVNRIAAPFASYEANKDTFLRQLPISWSAANPVLSTSESQVRGPLRDKLEDAQDAAVLYFLTLDGRYARFAADILQNVIEGYTGLVAPGSSANTGWLLPTDHLKEVREVATEAPIIYDFIYDWLKAGNKVWDVKSAALVDFNFNDDQMIFRTYVRLAKEVGHIGSNWSVLESPSLVHNALALDDPAERAAALRYYLDTDTSKQDSLNTVAKSYAAAGDIWPESFQYSGAVNEWSNYLMVLLERYDPANRLYSAYPNIAWSLKRTSELIFPNGDAIRFGDGHRDIGEPYFYYEIVYAHAAARGYADLQARYGALINAGVAAGKYNRASVASYVSLSPRQAPLQLLWFAESVAESANVFTLPRTDTLPFAGVALQRNLSATGSARNSLMAWVGGAAHVHSHATGMNLELFGAGEILGADGGLTAYGDTITENYYRVFAAHNTVIVNGASRGQGDWADLGMETVQTVAMEPQSFAPAVSPDFSFTCSSFNDTRGTRAEATQQRTVALVRTSPTTGFYVDFFRSDSRLSPEFHDYLYHNVGDALVLRDSAGAAIPLSADATRFESDIGDARQQPGWRYFEDPRSSGTFAGFVHARFTANNLPAGPTRMDVFIPGGAAREYTTVTSPPIKETSTTYDNRRAPTLVIRRTGEAWTQPFIAVYEPTYGTATTTIRSVEKIESAGLVVGVKVVSLVGPKTLTHYVLSLPTVSTYTDAALNLSFTGRFAIVSDNGDGSGALYLGSGSSLSYRSLKIASRSGVTTAAELRYAPGQVPVLTANSRVDLTAEGAPVIATPPATQAVAPGTAVSFSVAAGGTAPLSYQWKQGGAPIAGATSSTYALPGAQAADMGFYSVAVSNPSGTVDSAVAILTVNGGSSRLINVSTRGYVPPGGDLTPGFAFKGAGTKRLLIRAIGPALADFGLAGLQLADPKMEVIPFGRTTAVTSNDNWGTSADLAEPNATRAAVGAFELSTRSSDAALLATLSTATSNAYTVRITPSGAATDGIALAEVYDTEDLAAPVRLGNVSTRGFVGTGGQVLTPGLVIGGNGAKQLLIRAIGPGLTPFGVPEVLADPQINVIPAGRDFSVAGNDDWGDTPALRAAFAQVGAFATIDRKDAAVVVRLPPGGYTVVVSDAGGRTGTALVEVYDMDP